jgi:DnaJ-class molecular chaperone
MVRCSNCKGSGLEKVETEFCSCYTPEKFGCYVCQGKGFTKSGYDTCQKCHGSGSIEQDK